MHSKTTQQLTLFNEVLKMYLPKMHGNFFAELSVTTKQQIKVFIYFMKTFIR